MGYTHYWYRVPKLDKVKFAQFSNDCKKIADYCQNKLGIDLAGGMGEGLPKFTNTKVWLNGSDEQTAGTWTTTDEISIPWPSPMASLQDVSDDPSASKTKGHWFAGNLVSQRVAPLNNLTGKGSGSYETFGIDVEEKQSEWRKGEKLVFNCCKTAYRPYDLTVTACLIALKHYFPTDSRVSSDGEEKDWIDARFLCNNLLGYGMDTVIGEDEEG